MGSCPGHVSGSPGHRGLSWPCVRSTSAWGALLATPGGSLQRGQLVPTLGRAWISFSPGCPAVGQRWGGTDIPKLGLPSGNSFYLTNKEVLGALQPLGGRGSAPALLSSFTVAELKLN